MDKDIDVRVLKKIPKKYHDRIIYLDYVKNADTINKRTVGNYFIVVDDNHMILNEDMEEVQSAMFYSLKNLLYGLRHGK